jgi:hypothetical protein
MYRLFADWYRLVDITPNGEMLEKRWQGVDAFLNSIEDEDVLLDLIRVYVGSDPIDDEFINGFRQCFINADPAFPTRENDLEMKILAATALAECIENSRIDNIFTVAQSLCCYTFHGQKTVGVLSELIDIAGKYLYKESGLVRETEEITKLKLPPKLDQTFEEIKKHTPGNDLNNAWPHIERLLSSLRSALNTSVNAVNKNLATLDDNLDVQREENNILWWLYGEYSHDLRKKFSAISKPGVCLVLAKELVGLTLQSPGPTSARAFLDKGLSVAGVNSKKLPIKDVVNTTDRQWREDYISTVDFMKVSDFCPVHNALAKSLETDGENDWVPLCKKAIGVDPNSSMSGLDVSMQFYLEGLLIGSIAE